MTSSSNPKKITETITAKDEDILELKQFMEETAWNFFEHEYAHFRAQQGEITVVAYNSGKIVVSGPEADVQNIIETINSFNESELEGWTDHIGVDESGKGDYFGSLVIAGAFLDGNAASKLASMGVRDSKTLSDSKILNLSEEIEKIADTEVIILNPEKFNTLYSKMKNINRILSWGHARIIENLLERNQDCHLAISDQFSNYKSRITDALMERGKKIELIQMHRGERDLAVAAGSIMARAAFVKNLDDLGREYDFVFPKGASQGVIEAGMKFVESHGKKDLINVAKVNFATTDKILSN